MQRRLSFSTATVNLREMDVEVGLGSAELVRETSRRE